ncbi:hypothetical protein K474DRAFT_1652388 [Panus rudis PR-1116 ss-1]|nr:hypothetical protein K474DRAFT_1652388 [Panus rudis PR-1116 ss-1]
MPGPGKRHVRSKPTRSSASRNGATGGGGATDRSIPRGMETFYHDIDRREDWRDIVAFLCEYFDIPDMSRRSGLKKIHHRFAEIYNKLSEAFDEAARVQNDRVMGGVVGIWAKMSVDALLRNKLFRAGFIKKMLPVLDIPSTRIVGLQAFATVTHHGGMEVRAEIAKHTTIFMRMMKENPDDAITNELAVTIIAHATGAVINEEHIDAATRRLIDMSEFLRLLVIAMKQPDAKYSMINHAVLFLLSAAHHFHKEMLANNDIVLFLVACLRSTDLSIRCAGMASLLRLNSPASEDDHRSFDPRNLVASVSRRAPDELSEVMMDYGFPHCETVGTLNASRDYTKAMMGVAQDHDLYKLGRTVAQIILSTEFSVSQGAYEVHNERTGRRELMDIGLGFKMWADALPIAATTLRSKGSRSDLDYADILEIKYNIMNARIPKAIEIAQRGIARNPEVAYFYYAIGLGADRSAGLRAVKKGLKAKQTTPFVRNYLLWRATEHAGDLGVTKLANARVGEQDWSEGIALLMSSLEDAKTFISVAPPDARHMGSILNWYIVLTMAIKGPDLSLTLHELDDAFRKLEISRIAAEWIGHPPKRTQLRLTREMVVSKYVNAVKEWGDFIIRLDKMNDEPERLLEKLASRADDYLQAWLDNHPIEDEDGNDSATSTNGAGNEGHDHDHGHSCGEDHSARRKKNNLSHVDLYRCSHCGNPSAVLRKCGGCGKTRLVCFLSSARSRKLKHARCVFRYCDSACQKAHWSEHKAACKAAMAAQNASPSSPVEKKSSSSTTTTSPNQSAVLQIEAAPSTPSSLDESIKKLALKKLD